MQQRSTEHATFRIERTYQASPTRVFNAWADPAVKPLWFNRGAPNPTYTMDFRVGGSEFNQGGPPGGPVFTYRSTFQEIVPNERIVTAYTMDMGDTRISVSVGTLEFKTAGQGTYMTYTEQAAYFDGHDNAAQREEGCTEIMDALGEFLQRVPAT